MKKTFIFLLILSMIGCKTDRQNIIDLGTITVDKNISKSETIKILSHYPELKLFNSEKVESQTRTAHIIQNAIFFDRTKRIIRFDDYKAKAFYKGDTLELWLNNYNGYFGNGVQIQIFDHHFKVNNISPKALKNEVKFITTELIAQKLILNSNSYNKKDSIYGFINYRCKIDSLVEKQFSGYFKTIIQ